jgi:hypothetical protein
MFCAPACLSVFAADSSYLLRAEHADLHGRGHKVFESSTDLLLHKLGRKRRDHMHCRKRLCRHGRGCHLGMKTHPRDGCHVLCQACPARAVKPCYSEDRFHAETTF